MRLRADFSQPAWLTANAQDWVPSPQPGVSRVMLDRVGDEKARATSLVRYQPASRFPVHEHPGGEEILVLSGTFSDGSGDYPAGWYLRHPPGSRHAPFSEEGAEIFVKLWQMGPEEREVVRINTNDAAAWHAEGQCRTCPLFASAQETVMLNELPPGAPVATSPEDHLELLVLSGRLIFDDERLAAGSWLRLPPGHAAGLRAGEQGVRLYQKRSRWLISP